MGKKFSVHLCFFARGPIIPFFLSGELVFCGGF